MAKLTAVVLLPSPGLEDVTSTVFELWLTCANCRLVRIWRKDSARGVCRSVSMISGALLASASKATPPRREASVSCLSSCSPRIVLSPIWRRTAKAAPRSIPASRPISRLFRMLGDVGASGATAGVTIVRRTGEDPPALGFSSSSTTCTRLVATPCAMAAAWTGDWSEAEISMSTVLSPLDAWTRSASSDGVVASPSDCITGSSTSGVETVSMYDCTRAWLNVFPCWSSVTEPEFCMATKSLVEAV